MTETPKRIELGPERCCDCLRPLVGIERRLCTDCGASWCRGVRPSLSWPARRPGVKRPRAGGPR